MLGPVRMVGSGLVAALTTLFLLLVSSQETWAQGAIDSWAAKPDMNTARWGAPVAVGNDNKIYVFGGCCNGGNLYAVVEQYDPLTNSWTNCGGGPAGNNCVPMPTPRRDAAAVSASDGKIYVIGGCCNGSSGVFTTVEQYNPSTNTWTNCAPNPSCAPMPAGRGAFALVSAPGGKLYAIGGYEFFGTDTVQEYNPGSNTWTNCGGGPANNLCTPMPTFRYGLGAAVASNGRVYAIGGSENGNEVQEYNPTNNTWATRTYMSAFRDGLGVATALSTGKIYAIGGGVIVL